jgi:hypothetical protein
MVRAIAILKGDSKVRPMCCLHHRPAGFWHIHWLKLHTLPRHTTLLAYINKHQVNGQVVFTQSDENSPVTVSGEIAGNDANAQRGFHIQ